MTESLDAIRGRGEERIGLGERVGEGKGKERGMG